MSRILKVKHRGNEYSVELEGSVFNQSSEEIIKKIEKEIFGDEDMAKNVNNFTEKLIGALVLSNAKLQLMADFEFRCYLDLHNTEINAYKNLLERKDGIGYTDNEVDKLETRITDDLLQRDSFVLHLIFKNLDESGVREIDKLFYNSNCRTVKTTNGDLIVEVDISEKYTADIKYIIRGMYSKLSQPAKEIILEGKPKNSILKQVFDKDPIRKKQMEESLGISLPSEAELLGKIPVEELVTNI